jgi:hypothetical protein
VINLPLLELVSRNVHLPVRSKCVWRLHDTGIVHKNVKAIIIFGKSLDKLSD